MRVLSICFILFFVLGYPESNAEDFVVRGYGGSTCAQFGQNYKDNLDFEAAYYSWALGFMSGLNFAQKPGEIMRNLGGNTDENKAALRRYCANNPLKNYMDAVTAVYLGLPVL